MIIHILQWKKTYNEAEGTVKTILICTLSYNQLSSNIGKFVKVFM